MAVIYFQIVVVLSILGAYYAAVWRGQDGKNSRKIALVVVGFWLLWTVVLVNTTPLMIVQASVAIATFFIISSVSKNREEISSLKLSIRQALDAFPDEVVDHVSGRVSKSKRYAPITGTDHFDALVEAISGAKQRLIILSGWVTDYVVDEEMEKWLRDALLRGVDVYIGFGWTSSKFSDDERPENRAAYKRLEQVSEWASSNAPGQLQIQTFANHAKLLVCDEEYFICGSHNWLSNRSGRNFELSHKVTDPEAVTETASVALAKFGVHPP